MALGARCLSVAEAIVMVDETGMSGRLRDAVEMQYATRREVRYMTRMSFM